MMKGYRFVVALVAGLCLSALAFAGTPVEDLIARYEVEQGAKQYKASGAAMAVGRTFLKKYPIADSIWGQLMPSMRHPVLKYIFSYGAVGQYMTDAHPLNISTFSATCISLNSA
jgi:hypothetical protein